jgi:dihydroxyacetone kinase-like protein
LKKLINKPEDLVAESLAGMAAAHSDLIKVNYNPNYIVRADAPIQGKVGIVSGGGSGHEPMHGGLVGMGMLDAACPGDVFTSPTPDQMEAATKAVNGGAGALHIVKNYTGDVMNFEMAAELCQAEGIDVEAVVINDDVAVKDSLYTAGRRGVGITVLAEKLCGAAAEQRRDLKKVADICRQVNAFDIGADEMEIGIGIHGEPGRERMPLKTAREIVEMMSEAITSDLPYQRGDSVIAMVNGMGGTPQIELYLVFHELNEVCKGKGIKIVRQLIGNYITSLEMAGCSITLLKTDDELLKLWDAPVHTPALRWGA